MTGFTHTFAIGSREIGTGKPCFVIAEAGSNHNQSYEQALALIDVAAEAGADAVKFQTFKAQRLYAADAGKSDYLGDERSIYDIIASLEMPEAWIPKLAEEARSRGLAFLSTPFHEEAIELLDPHVDAFKVASYELTHVPLLKAVAARSKPMICSTGAADLDEIQQAIGVLDDLGVEDRVLLQCTAAYPAPLESVNARTVMTLRERFQVLTGLSDHSADPLIAPLASVALGGCVIEKHYTLSKRLPGPDHQFAVEPHELKAMIDGIRQMELALGTGVKEPHAVEGELRAFARRSIFTRAKVAKGDVFTRENLDVLRRGKLDAGLEPARLDDVLGKKATRDLEPGLPLQADHVEGGL